MFSIIRNNSNVMPKVKELESFSQAGPVLVYSARIDALPQKSGYKKDALSTTDLSSDWSAFMDDLNTKMLEKIYF